MLYESHLYNNTPEFLFDESNSIKGIERVLGFENSVMSPVFMFYSKEKGIKFIMNGVLTLVHNTYSSGSSLNYRDICLDLYLAWIRT